ncbi:hypothetical protein K2X92_02585 [Candidatus Gracilibacteria bacterium]|nr:hypothetical protein [Candidatus Gracilibacteria bacterium]
MILAVMAGAARSAPGYDFYAFLFIITIICCVLQVLLMKKYGKSFFMIFGFLLNLLILLSFIPTWYQYTGDNYTWCNRIDLGYQSGCQLSKMIEFLEEEGKKENFTVTKVIDNSVIESIRGLFPEAIISDDKTYLIVNYQRDVSGDIYASNRIYVTSAGLVYVSNIHTDPLDRNNTFGMRRLIKF